MLPPDFFRSTVSRPTPAFRIETLTLALSLLFTLLCNQRFWAQLIAQRDLSESRHWILLACTALLVTGIQWFVLLILSNRWTLRPLLILLAITTPAAVYFMNQFGVYIDMAMVRNAMETDLKESSELLDLKMLPYLLTSAVITWGLLKLKIKAEGLRQALWKRLLALLAALSLAALGLWPVSGELIPLIREQKELRFLVTPANLLIATPRVIAEKLSADPLQQGREIIGADAKQTPAATQRQPMALILVVGETVRAANWGLNGYARQTTPYLKQAEVINFPEATSCGTDTATSVPCMFSINGKRNYNQAEISRRESLLHLLNRAGVEVLWRDNQSGCKGVCEGLPLENIQANENPKLCNGKRCFDEILIDGLKEKISHHKGDVLIVLHMLGNHGPAYFERYPPEFAQWQPTCDTTDLASCTQSAIVNTYDNAVLYTDHVLAQTIAALRQIKSHSTGLIYLSDHGESLGEKGLYLHGVPYAIAPAEQTHIPFVLWFSDQFKADRHLDSACLVAKTQRPVSHDNLFHTVLGLFQVQTDSFDPALNLMDRCLLEKP